MQLAYVFWHWPAAEVATADYEASLQAFHRALALPGSGTARLALLPWADVHPRPYEDWYPAADWSALGDLEEQALRGDRRDPHDAAAKRLAGGAGGVYGRVRAGEDGPASWAAWLDRPDGLPHDRFLDELAAAAPAAAIWQRRLVLGPAPEFAVRAASPAALPWPAIQTLPQPLGR